MGHFYDRKLLFSKQFFNPEIEGLGRPQSRDIGIKKSGRDPGIRDAGIANPSHMHRLIARKFKKHK